MKLLSSILFATSLLLSTVGEAATIENVKAKVDQHDRLEITYDYTSSSAGTIYLSISQDGGSSFDSPLSVSGDIGPGIKPGAGKRIIWDVFMDTPGLRTEQLVARVSTVPPEMELVQAQVPKTVSPKSKPLEKPPTRQPEQQYKEPQTRMGKRRHGMMSPAVPKKLRELNRANLILRSAILPGFGQISTGRKRGYIYMIGCASAIGAAYFTNSYYEDEIEKYNQEKELFLRPSQTYSSRKSHEDAMMKRYDNMKLYRDANFAAFMAAGLIYGWNLIEIGTLNIGLSSTHAGLSLNVTF